MAKQGSLLFVLHAHMPFVRHPDNPRQYEETWLYEAVNESYVPLLMMLDRLIGEGVGFSITISLSPTLLTMLGDDLLKSRLDEYLKGLYDLASMEVRRTKNDPGSNALAKMYKARAKASMDYIASSGGLINAFKKIKKSGRVEFMTTSATHAYLPGLAPFKQAVSDQIRVGIETFKGFMGDNPRGFWIPECGYYEGLDKILRARGVSYTFLESHGILFGTPRPKFGIHKPVKTKAGLIAFGRDIETSDLVWSAKTGYPADGAYREFHKDIGYELGASYIDKALKRGGLKAPTGIKYDRIGGGVYDEAAAIKRAKEHAMDFIEKLSKRGHDMKNELGFEPLFAAPYDAELFGHWWHEGPVWLEHALRNAAKSGVVDTVTPSEYLKAKPGIQTVSPISSSWGEGGHGDMWINNKNKWIIPHMHGRMRLLRKLASSAKRGKGRLILRALNQAKRELMLACSGDWAFLISKASAGDYPERRVMGHLDAFDMMAEMVLSGGVDRKMLELLETRDKIFPDMD